MYVALNILLVIGFLFQVNAFEDATLVKLPKGNIKGHILLSEKGKPYYAFQEIPYAAPPTGNNRFQLPKDPEPWSGVLNVTRNTVVCYQSVVKYANLKISEDCLYMNVYTPVVPGTKKLLPVLVWIHGGGFFAESSTYEYYGPKYVMDQEVVVVTFNYRLGPFGFLSTFDDIIPANLGLKDQHFALEWIHENIKLFGGNKSHVTIVGESAGSMAVGIHLLGPWEKDKELYHAAIMQSGTPLFFSRGNKARETAFDIGRQLDKQFSSKNSRDLLKVLQNASAADILDVKVPELFWWPIVETKGLFKHQMYDCLLNGNIKKIPILIGFNSEEWLEKDENLTSTKLLGIEIDKDHTKLLEPQFNLSSIDKAAMGNLLYKLYTNTSFEKDIGAYIRFDTDRWFATPTPKQVVLNAKYADIYFYQFSYKGKLGMQMQTPNLTGCERVAHAEDLKYMWDDQTNSDLSKFPAEDGLMLHRYVKMWTNFVKYHNPTPEKDPLLENIIWPKVDPNKPENIQYLNINSTFEIRSNPRNYQKLIKVYDHYITPEIII